MVCWAYFVLLFNLLIDIFSIWKTPPSSHTTPLPAGEGLGGGAFCLLKPCRFQLQSQAFFHSEHHIHVLYGLSHSTFEQIVDA